MVTPRVQGIFIWVPGKSLVGAGKSGGVRKEARIRVRRERIDHFACSVEAVQQVPVVLFFCRIDDNTVRLRDRSELLNIDYAPISSSSLGTSLHQLYLLEDPC